jgi:carboxymethylenebutenolidase
MNSVHIASDEGLSFEAYVALPEHPRPAPGLMLLQYICGVNGVMRRLADGFARQGYLVMVPDLFWRQAPGVRLIEDPSKPSAQEQARALELNARFDDDAATRDMTATLQALRTHPNCDGRAGALGYCLGGRMAYLAAARTNVDCAVGYYAVNLQNYLDEAAAISSPLLLHMATADMLVSEPVRTQVCTALATNAQIEIALHPDVNHAFALPGGPNYNAEATERANAASLAFLKRHLPTTP